jgi:hypothetical protein
MTYHLEKKRSFIDEGKADIQHIGTNDQLADLLAKADESSLLR